MEWQGACDFSMNIPDWFDKFRIDDAKLGAAYDSAQPQWRAALKTGIAISHFQFGAADAQSANLRISDQLGLKTSVNQVRARWVLLFIGDDVAAAARICALAIAPRLAGVDDVYAVIAGKPKQQALLSLELCGIEDIFCAGSQDCTKLLRYVTTLGETYGRICFLHEGKLDKLAHSNPLSEGCMNLRHRPHLLLASPKGFDKECLEFCQGRQIETRKDSDLLWDAVFTGADQDARKFASRLYLGPGCEGFWLFSDLMPAFFLEQMVSIELTGNNGR